MTMQFPHPDDERLSALAEHDPEAVGDLSLRAHVSSCDRCAALVSELTALRSALADLPDLVPSRPLRLLLPVSDPRRAGGFARRLFARRLFAPALAAGLLLSVAGGIGSFVTNLPAMTTSSAGAPGLVSDGHFRPAVPSAGRDDSSSFEEHSPAPLVVDRSKSLENTPAGGGGPWWPGVLGAGLIVLVAALILRFAVEPRAG